MERRQDRPPDSYRAEHAIVKLFLSVFVQWEREHNHNQLHFRLITQALFVVASYSLNYRESDLIMKIL